MNGYVAFYKGKRLEVYAETSYKAQQEAVKLFKARKSWDVHVHLCETGTNGTTPGTQVTTHID